MAHQDTLPVLMQGLPQELYDTIYDLVFTAGQEPRYIGYREYDSPVQLQVDRASRKRFAKSYYGNGATFVFEGATNYTWVQTLPRSHSAQITHMQCLFRGFELHLRPKSERFAQIKMEMQQFHSFSEQTDYRQRSYGRSYRIDDVLIFDYTKQHGGLVRWESDVADVSEGGVMFRKVRGVDT